MKIICSSHIPLYRDHPLYKVHQIGRAATGEQYRILLSNALNYREIGVAPDGGT